MRRVLVTGGGGLLGGALIRLAPPATALHATRRTAPVVGCPATAVELSDRAAVDRLFRELRPDLVIHTAYSTADGARDIVAATASVVDASAACGAELVHLSTDALLDGEHAPYAESAPPAPVHAYGRWKAAAEETVRERLPAAAVVRTSLLVSFDPLDPGTARVASGLRGETEARLFVDELRCPILVEDLAAQIWELAALPAAARAGVWHLAGPEALSPYSLGLLVAARLGLPAERLVPVRSDPAGSRPRDLRLLTTRADGALAHRPRTIADALAARPNGGYLPT